MNTTTSFLDAGHADVIGHDQFEAASRTDVGLRRSHNQDACATHLAHDPDRWRSAGHIFIVADGMGGHAVGEKASAKAVRDIPHTYEKYAGDGVTAALRRAIVEVNTGIHNIGQENPEFRGLGTTATTLVIRPEGAYLGHVGDSRAYRVRDGKIEQLTFDHSAVWEIARRQRVRPEDLPGIRSNVILRSLGPDGAVDPDLEGPHPLKPGDIFLMCSDGLSGQLSDYEIGAVAEALPPDEACDFLVELANLRGGPDNITALIIRVTPSADDPPPPPPGWKLPFPWPLAVLAFGLILALAALWASGSGWDGPARWLFGVAVVAIAAGLGGLYLHVRFVETVEPGKPKLNVYRSTKCRIERGLIEKLITAETTIRDRLEQNAPESVPAVYSVHREKSEAAQQRGDLTEAFRERCRAMNVLVKAFNVTRKREEMFQPVWDKHG